MTARYYGPAPTVVILSSPWCDGGHCVVEGDSCPGMWERVALTFECGDQPGPRLGVGETSRRPCRAPELGRVSVQKVGTNKILHVGYLR